MALINIETGRYAMPRENWPYIESLENEIKNLIDKRKQDDLILENLRLKLQLIKVHQYTKSNIEAILRG